MQAELSPLPRAALAMWRTEAPGWSKHNEVNLVVLEREDGISFLSIVVLRI